MIVDRFGLCLFLHRLPGRWQVPQSKVFRRRLHCRFDFAPVLALAVEVKRTMPVAIIQGVIAAVVEPPSRTVTLPLLPPGLT